MDKEIKNQLRKFKKFFRSKDNWIVGEILDQSRSFSCAMGQLGAREMNMEEKELMKKCNLKLISGMQYYQTERSIEFLKLVKNSGIGWEWLDRDGDDYESNSYRSRVKTISEAESFIVESNDNASNGKGAKENILEMISEMERLYKEKYEQKMKRKERKLSNVV